MATARWREQRRTIENGEGLKGPQPSLNTGQRRGDLKCRNRSRRWALRWAPLALTHLPAAAQTKVTNEGISATEIVIGTHQDLSGPIKVWGVPVSNGMKMAVEKSTPPAASTAASCS